MSVILDALKKLEREKASRRSGPVDIVPEITLSSRRRERTGKWKIPAMLSGIVIVTAVATSIAVTYFISGERKAAPVAAANTDTDQLPRSFTAVPEQPPAAITVTAPVPVSEVVRESAPESVSPPPHEENTPGRQAERFPPRSVNREETARGDSASSASLVVSGIAWQDDRVDRRAVVNGALVGEGAEVGGAAIVRIYRDKVRFSIDGRTFDVPMTGQSQGKKTN